MHEFTCERCGIRVIQIVGELHPEIIYCLQCRFIESIDDEGARRELAKRLGVATKGD